ncbi:MAG TPA: glycosyltransferase [Polyangiaceae bacterium]
MRPRIAVIADSPDENWPSMDLVAEMLVKEWRTTLASEVDAEKIEWAIPNAVRRVSSDRRAFTVDRILGRFGRFPLHAALSRRRFDFFHVADHTYAQLVHVLPADRTGVYCHDLDAFRSLLEPEKEPRSAAFRTMVQVQLAGLRRARLVFHSTREVGRRLASIVDPTRLVYAPYGLSPEYTGEADPNDGADQILASLEGAPFVLHVGSSVPRKRLDVLFEVFAKLHARRPELRLVQQGAKLSDVQREQTRRLGIASAIFQPPKLERRTLAGLYRRARAVLLTSDAEGFGLPVLEALACGAPVVASALPTTMEVGGAATAFVPIADVSAFVDAVERYLDDDSYEAKSRRIEQARKFSWKAHAEVILGAYRALVG